MTRRWGDKSKKIEARLLKSCVVMRNRRTGKKHRFVKNFSAIAERYDATREHVRQIAAELGVRSLYHVKQRRRAA